MLYFIRDENENLIGFKYNNVLYYYIKNIQEDILGIQNSTFEQIVTYEYDSYGKITSIKDNNNNDITDSNHIGLINPFRYRSYYYDNETELYYLNSRYYNPTWGRFINADNYTSTGQGFIGCNMYSYTANNYVNRIDIDGLLWFQIAGTIVGLLVGGGAQIISNISSGKSWNDGLAGALVSGAFTGLLATTGFGLTTAGAVVTTFGGAFIESTTNQLVSGEEFSANTLFQDTAINGGLGLVGGMYADEIIKINKGWFRPESFKSSFTGKYTQKFVANKVVDATTNAAINSTVSKINNNNNKKIVNGNISNIPEKQILKPQPSDIFLPKGKTLPPPIPNSCNSLRW